MIYDFPEINDIDNGRVILLSYKMEVKSFEAILYNCEISTDNGTFKNIQSN